MQLESRLGGIAVIGQVAGILRQPRFGLEHSYSTDAVVTKHPTGNTPLRS